MSLYANWRNALDALDSNHKLIIRPFDRNLLMGQCVVQDFLEVLASEGVVTSHFLDNDDLQIIKNANQRPSLLSLVVRYHLKSILKKNGSDLTPALANKSSDYVKKLGIVDPNGGNYSLFTFDNALAIYTSSMPAVNQLLSMEYSDGLSSHLCSTPHLQEFPGMPKDFDLYSTDYMNIINLLVKDILNAKP
jgi:hypothetical protein